MHESPSERNIIDAVRELARKWRIIVPFAVVTPAVAFHLTASQPAVYTSSADVLLNRQGFVISDLRDVTFWYPNRALLTQVQLARVPEIGQRVVDAAGLANRGRYGFLAQSWVTPGDFADVMTFHVRDGDPQLASRLATTYAREYVAYRHELDTRRLRSAIAAVSGQLEAARAQGLRAAAYANLVWSKQQLQLALAAVETNATLVRPGGEAVQTAPRPLHALYVGLAFGLLIGVGLAALAQLLDPRAKAAVEISTELGLPLLGRLPLVDGTLLRRRSAMERHLRDDTYVDSLHLLRTSLELEDAGAKGIIMVTSAVAREGKSTTAATLAVALARAGRHVVLVDLDVKRPSVARLFGVQGAPGVAELLRGERSLDSVLRVVRLENASGTLRVVPAGTLGEADAGELAAAPGLPAALGQLRALGDVVLVDTAPLLQSSDALAVSAHVDGLLLVASKARYRRRYAAALRHALALSRAVPLGLIVIGGPHEAEYGLAYSQAGARGGRADTYALGGA